MELEQQKQSEYDNSFVPNSNSVTLNDIDIPTLKDIKKFVENMSKVNHIEVLRILSKHLSYKILSENENMNGIYINLTDLNNEAINDLLKYIKYVEAQEDELKYMEDERESYKKLLSK